MRIFVALATLFTAACCTSLPKLAPKRVPFPAIAPTSAGVTESAEVLRDERRNRDVPIRIYTPANANAPLPVVVFSHGIGENRDSYAWVGRALAQHGFMSIHITHAGTDRAVLERGYRHLYRAVKQRENWVARPRDVSFVLDSIATRNDADMNRIAAVGHSAGAFTAFAVAGMRTVNDADFHDERVKVAIPMSMPRMNGVVPADGYDAIAIPLLNMTGTCDTSIIYRTFPKHRRIPFETTRAASHLVTIEGATHDSFVLEDERRETILAITIAFLRAYLLDDAAARAWFEEAGNADVRGVAISAERKTGAAR
jgi:predicted dienelactone hydrolase